MESWHIKAREHQCSVSEEKFEDGQEFYTALLPDPESSGYLRVDFSEKAWEEREAKADAVEPFSFWKSVYKVPVIEEKAEVMEKESAEGLLKRLIEEDEAYTENTRYILAVMLERKKLLKENDTQPTPTGILRVYEHRKEGDIFIIKDPNIPLSEVEAVQMEVMEMLDPKEKEEVKEEEGVVEEAPSEEAVQEDEAVTEDRTEDSDKDTNEFRKEASLEEE